MPDDQERRSQPRHAVRVVTEISAKDGTTDALGVIREISISGGRFLTNRAFSPGDELQLSIHLAADESSSAIDVGCSVVRGGPLDASRMGLWNYEIAVRFDERLEHVADEIEELAARVRRSASS